MPKVPTSHNHSTSGPQTVLKRNQACHQCRKRKLKCDAQRPCATCIRSHTNLVANAAPGVTVPPEPECTYDEIPEHPVHEPRNRYERLEGRINELEALLKEKDAAVQRQTQQLQEALQQQTSLQTRTQQPTPFLSPAPDSLSFFVSSSGPSPFSPSPSPSFASAATFGLAGAPSLPLGGPSIFNSDPPFSITPFSPFPTGHFGSPEQLPSPPIPTPSSGSGSVSGEGIASRNGSGNVEVRSSAPATTTSSPAADPLLEMMWSAWPAKLPAPDLLQHMVDIFFVSHPHANRLVHQATFLTSLTYPPSHPSFPDRSLLHAICAYSSIFSKAVDDPPHPVVNKRPGEEIFQEKIRRLEGRPESFGELHAKWATEAQDDNASIGERSFETLQSVVVCAWYYYCHAKWVELWLMTGRALRFAVPLGLNVTSTHGPLLRSWKAPSILPPPATAIEAETRRNVFWLAYVLERWQSSSSGWAMVLGDEDTTQVLPARLSDFEEGNKIPIGIRQRIQTPKLMTTHPPDLTDSFSLFIKGTIILSKVKTFGLRFKSKYFASLPPNASTNVVFTAFSDSELQDLPTEGESPIPVAPIRVDPREHSSFKALDSTITAFRLSFPKHLRDPIQRGVVDPDLYIAHLSAHTATILLHDSHADFSSPNCPSAEKMLLAARAILDLVYTICSTSFDLTLLHHFSSFSWFTSARVLIRFLKAKLDAGDHAEALALRGELEVIRLALSRFGERIPLGYRQSKMLDDLLTGEIGPIHVFPAQLCEGVDEHGEVTMGRTVPFDPNQTIESRLHASLMEANGDLDDDTAEFIDT